MASAPNSTSEYFQTLDASTKAKYLEKLVSVNSVDPFSLSESEWCADQSTFPTIEFFDIFAYLVCSTNFYTRTEFKAYKSLSAYSQACNGWVKDVRYHCPPGCDYVVLSGEVISHHLVVMPSEEIMEKPLRPWVIAGEDGTIHSAHCDCMSSISEACTHISALLFFIENSVRLRLQEQTSAPVQSDSWVPPNDVNNTEPINIKASEIDFTSSESKGKLLTKDSVKSPLPKQQPKILSGAERKYFLDKLNSLPVSKRPVILSVFPEYSGE